MVRDVTLGLALAVLAVPAGAEDARGMLIKLPSGAEARWQETLKDDAAGQDITYRFRFVVPDLLQRIAPPDDSEALAEGAADRGPIDIDTETASVAGMVEADVPDDADSMSADAPSPDADADADAEEAADDMVGYAVTLDAAGPEQTDPLHQDVVWLCQNWALPRISGTLPRPGQIIISLSNKEVAFGTYAPDAIQLFEAFSLPADRDACAWEPW